MAGEATEVFHDLKPLPDFIPIPLWPVVLAVVLGALLWLLARGRKTAPSKPAPVESPQEEALRELSALRLQREEGVVNVRAFSLRLSFALRRYLERVISLPATDLTSAEVAAALLPAIRKKLPVLPVQNSEELARRTTALLRFCEQAAFSDRSDEEYSLDSSRFAAALDDGEGLVRDLHHRLQKEEERTRSVVPEVKSAAL